MASPRRAIGYDLLGDGWREIGLTVAGASGLHRSRHRQAHALRGSRLGAFQGTASPFRDTDKNMASTSPLGQHECLPLPETTRAPRGDHDRALHGFPGRESRPGRVELIGGDGVLVSQALAGRVLNKLFASQDDVRSHHRLEDAALRVEWPSLQEKPRIV